MTDMQKKMMDTLGLSETDFEKPEETTEEFILEVMADHEERICLMELGITEV